MTTATTAATTTNTVTPDPPFMLDDPEYDASWQHMTRTLAHYERYEQIGEGTYGQVYRARCKDTGRIVALKKMRIHHGGYWGMPLQFIREIKILKRLSHPNLLSMIEVVTSKGVEYLDEDDPPQKNTASLEKADKITDAREGFKGNLFLCLEYVPHDLTGILDIAYQFTEVQIKCIFRQLLDALAYMHEQKYVHRDIKSSNILLDSHFRVKLADFGLARSLEPPILEQMHDRNSSSSSYSSQQQSQLELTNKVITLWYRPPEILVGATNYGTAVDVWSAGCILAELLLGKPLFTGKTELDQLNLVVEMMGTPSQDAWDFLSKMKRVRTGSSVSGGNDNNGSTSSSMMNIDLAQPVPAKLREKYSNKLPVSQPGITLNFLEKLLEWDPRKRSTAAHALQNRYFWSQPVAPLDPSELGSIQVGPGGHFHEFQTKKKRREAKVKAEQAKEDALFKGATEEEAKDQFDRVYRGLMKKVAEEGFQNDEKPKKAAPLPAEPAVQQIPPPLKESHSRDESLSSSRRGEDRKREGGGSSRDGGAERSHHSSSRRESEEERRSKRERDREREHDDSDRRSFKRDHNHHESRKRREREEDDDRRTKNRKEERDSRERRKSMGSQSDIEKIAEAEPPRETKVVPLEGTKEAERRGETDRERDRDRERDERSHDRRSGKSHRRKSSRKKERKDRGHSEERRRSREHDHGAARRSSRERDHEDHPRSERSREQDDAGRRGREKEPEKAREREGGDKPRSEKNREDDRGRRERDKDGDKDRDRNAERDRNRNRDRSGDVDRAQTRRERDRDEYHRRDSRENEREGHRDRSRDRDDRRHAGRVDRDRFLDDRYPQGGRFPPPHGPYGYGPPHPGPPLGMGPRDGPPPPADYGYYGRQPDQRRGPGPGPLPGGPIPPLRDDHYGPPPQRRDDRRRS